MMDFAICQTSSATRAEPSVSWYAGRAILLPVELAVAFPINGNHDS